MPLQRDKCSLLPLSLAGPGNQYCGLKEGIIMAAQLGTDIIMPPFIPHGTIRKDSRSHYLFEETFDVEQFQRECRKQFGIEALSLQEVTWQLQSVETFYAAMMRRDEASTRQALEYLGFYRQVFPDLPDDEQVGPHAERVFLRDPNDIQQWYEGLPIEPGKLIIAVGIFNSLKLGGIDRASANEPCTKNHCLNCPPNPAFDDLYQKVDHCLAFSRGIREIGDRYIEAEFGDQDFLSFHLRICDIPRQRSFEECYSGYTENVVEEALWRYCDEYNIDRDKLFVAAPPQLFTAVSNLERFKQSRYRRFFQDGLDPHIAGMVEQYICTRSEVFIRSYTNTPDQARKAHSRSSWAELVEGMRRSQGKTRNFTLDDKIDHPRAIGE